jgi:hypothetical protein
MIVRSAFRITIRLFNSLGRKMISSTFPRLRRWLPLALLTATTLTAQQNPPISQNFSERLAFGKSMYVKNAHGGNIAFDAISTDLQNWGRFTILSTPEKADLVAEIASYESGTVSLGGNTSAPDDRSAQSGVRKDFSSSSVTLKVYEAKTNRELWTGSEKIKSAFKKKTEQDNVVAAAEKLFLRFHDAVEPPGKP